ncbi:MAG: DNA translocase FtsK [Candidatus Pacebacteria bacterium]|nr:DNA translocase FtsK [Candidatus Paceibacterota bacterium]
MSKKRRKNRKKKRTNKIHYSLLGEMKNKFFGLFKNLFQGFPAKIKRQILSSFIFLITAIAFLGLFGEAGKGGGVFQAFLFQYIGYAVYIIPLIFFTSAICVLYIPKKFLIAKIAAILSIIFGVSGGLSLLNKNSFLGGKIGDMISTPLIGIFGELVSSIVFLIIFTLGVSIFWYLLASYVFVKKEENETMVSKAIKKVIALPQFKISKIEEEQQKNTIEKIKSQDFEDSKTKDFKEGDIKFILPPLDLLKQDEEQARAGDIKQNAIIIKKTLENFNIEVAMDQVNIGPTVTQYTLKPAEGVKLSKITGLSNNLSLALAAHPIRIEAPIPGKALVGIEIPNKVRSRVRLRNLLSQPDFQKPGLGLRFALGRDVSGVPMFADLAYLPHILVAGATGTGKTIFLNSFILSLLYRNSPEHLRFILIDPKRVEFPIFNDLPHLLCPVILDAERAANALKWMVSEMERRFGVLLEAKAKNIVSFNEKALRSGESVLPYIVLIIDELADLMATSGKEIEATVVRIAQMARAVGIHLVLATQRPSVEVLTGLIKANITARVSFQVASHFDSRTILDTGGSEKLLGLGDMLYLSADIVKPKRIQGAFISEEETKKVVKWLIDQKGPAETLDDELSGELVKSIDESISEAKTFDTGEDSLYEDAKAMILQYKRASASLLQRRLRIGYSRAARILDMLEAEGIIGPAQGSQPREIYADKKPNEFEEFENKSFE